MGYEQSWRGRESLNILEKWSPVFFDRGVAINRPGQLVALRISFACFGSVLKCLADPGISESATHLNTCALFCLFVCFDFEVKQVKQHYLVLVCICICFE